MKPCTSAPQTAAVVGVPVYTCVRHFSGASAPDNFSRRLVRGGPRCAALPKQARATSGHRGVTQMSEGLAWVPGLLRGADLPFQVGRPRPSFGRGWHRPGCARLA